MIGDGPCQRVDNAHEHVGCDRSAQQAIAIGLLDDLVEVQRERPREPVQVAHHQHHHSMCVRLRGVVFQAVQLQGDCRCEAAEESVMPRTLIPQTCSGFMRHVLRRPRTHPCIAVDAQGGHGRNGMGVAVLLKRELTLAQARGQMAAPFAQSQPRTMRHRGCLIKDRVCDPHRVQVAQGVS